MLCPACGFDNPLRMSYCGGCGSALRKACPRCGSGNSKVREACSECRVSLSEASADSPWPRDPPSSAERRWLTVVFCDLVGSTSLSDKLDPEDFREILRDYQNSAAAVVDNFGGYTAQYLGDGLLVYFGYPVAHEDDARRGVCTGLEMIKAIEALNERLRRARGISLTIRVGIHSGRVVVGEMGGRERREHLALGPTPNIAARLQSIAKPNEVVVSAATLELVEGFFAFQSLGTCEIRGLSETLEVYRILAQRDVDNRFEVALSQGLGSLVGRREEIDVLRACFHRSGEGGQVVLVEGDAGLGKSHLIHQLREDLAEHEISWLACRCSAYSRNTAFHPLIDLLHRLFGFEDGHSVDHKLGQLETELESFRLGHLAVPLLASLLSLPLADRSVVAALSGQQQRQKTLEVLLLALRELCSRSTVVLIVEDLHWIDPSSLECLELVLTRLPKSLLIVLSFRPDFEAPWSSSRTLTRITLDRLSDKQVELMIGQLTTDRPLPLEIRREIVDKTDGVPLFVEELTKMVLESELLRKAEGSYEQAGAQASLAIPSTLNESLMARLDRLGTAKSVAQLAATLGREFTHELLGAIADLNDESLSRELDRLLHAGLIYRRGRGAQKRYGFKHALIQDTAYKSLLRRQRRRYHLRATQVLEQQFPGIVAAEPALIAHHLTLAGRYELAIDYWQKAGERAVSRSENLEAVHYFSEALQLLEAVPASSARDQKELTLRIALGIPLTVARGYASPEIEEVYARARELCRSCGTPPQLCQVLLGLWHYSFVREELDKSIALARQFLTVVEELADATFYPVAQRTLATSCFYRGEFAATLRHAELGVASNRSGESCHTLVNLVEPAVSLLTYQALSSWFLGYPEQAVESGRESLALAHRSGHPNTLALTHFLNSWLQQFCGDFDAVREQADIALDLSSEHGFPLWKAGGSLLRGSGRVGQGAVQEGLREILQGLDEWRKQGAQRGLPYFLSIAADAYHRLGKPTEGLRSIARARRNCERTNEFWWEAELHRLEGELLLTRAGTSSQTRGEACFLRAAEVACRQESKSLELRTAMSLFRLWRSQGRECEARDYLSKIYDKFTEGFETTDLRQAECLLQTS